MNRSTIAVLLAAVPALAMPQVQALDQARGAQAVQDAGVQRTTLIIDDTRTPSLPETPSGAIDLNAAADRLEGQTVTQPPAPAPASGSRDVAPENYVIQRGDTLWDLSGKFLESPWYWPKLWSYNPQIENPHWIYPGNPLRLSPPAPKT
jgi:nucleoid-associated protein YgaU